MNQDNNSNITSIAKYQNVDIAQRDANDTSIAQAAQCALDTLNHKLQLIREQAANATTSDTERHAQQSEMNQLIAEIRQATEVANIYS